MTRKTLEGRPFLHTKLWLTAAYQVFRQRTTMLWLFYFTSNKHEQI